MNKIISKKNSVFVFLVGPRELRKSQIIYYWLKNGTFQPNFDEFFLIYQHFQAFCDEMQKEIENFDFVEGVNLDFLIYLKTNRVKYLFFFDDSCQKICALGVLKKIAVAGKHRGLSTRYKKHSLFHNSEIGPGVELQNAHIVSFQSPRDVLLIGRLGVQLGLGSSLVDW